MLNGCNEELVDRAAYVISATGSSGDGVGDPTEVDSERKDHGQQGSVDMIVHNPG